MSSISINKGIATAVLAIGVAFSGQLLAEEDAMSTPMDPKGMPTETEATKFEAKNLNAEVTNTLAKFNAEQPGAKEIVDAAKGVLVGPTITKAGLVIGGAGGQCALQVGGETVDYYTYGGVKYGFLAGVQSYSMIVLFNTEAALGKFRSSKRDWDIGADVGLTVAETGKTGKLDTNTLKSAMVAFIFGNQGLMGDASLKTGRFKRVDAK
jgi:lipid-binding SYLF domain-containing protein